MSIEQPPPETVFQPFDIDLEQGLLGLMIRDPGRVIPQVAQIVDDWHFHDPLHQRIFAQITAWAMEDQPISALTLAAAMKADPGIASLKIGRDYFQAMTEAAPVITPARSLAVMLRDLAMRRDALAAMGEAMDQLKTTPTSVRDAMRTVTSVTDKAEQIAVGDRFKTTAETADDAIRQAERASATGVVRAVRTGIYKLDKETGGFQGADFIVVAGKSGMGKSALMGGISWRAAAAYYPVIVFSLEMKRMQWVQRIITDIDFDDPDIDKALEYRKFRAIDAASGFTNEEFARLVLAKQRIPDWPWLEIHDDDGLSMAQIAARARAFQAKWKNDPVIREKQGLQPDQDPIGLVICDYLQIVDPASRQFIPREQEVRAIARGHKGLAKSLDWPVMAGSQINEDDKARAKDSKKPQAGDVRESKAIFHEADIMLAPYRQAQALQDTKPDATPGEPAHIAWLADMRAARHQFELIGLKNRMGRRFSLELYGDMAASAVRDDQPQRRGNQQLADDLLGQGGGVDFAKMGNPKK
jgi:replicative DNA helicase